MQLPAWFAFGKITCILIDVFSPVHTYEYVHRCPTLSLFDWCNPPQLLCPGITPISVSVT